MEPTIEWIDPATIKMIDQTQLPYKLQFLYLTDYREVASAIKNMNVRGAPAIGVSAAMGVALAAIEFSNSSKNTATKSEYDKFKKKLNEAAKTITDTRPTAVNLFWAVDNILKKVNELESKLGFNPKLVAKALVQEAKEMAILDVKINYKIGENGSEILNDGDTVLTHCNAGSLATVQYGTALAPIRWAIEHGKKINVIADETRPRLQGATLTAFQLQKDGIPVKVISDTSSGLLMMLGKVQKVIVGADRITKDAVFNKTGTYLVALAAKRHSIPFYVAAPISTLSLEESSSNVEIEQRNGDEVANILGKLRIIPEGVETINYAFDITPFDLITGVITEDGVFTQKQLLDRYVKSKK
jgi:methylthioribose-1-phosphate isomerase